MVFVSSDSGFALGPRAGDARALSLQLLVILGRTTGMGSLGNNGGIVGMALGDVDFFYAGYHISMGASPEIFS